ncbi:uncharacterized protein LOC114669693 [Erpetoichthys calabaricus]|uniref:uncharacterized protein LOC114669693 n=1 Tax=Erpetoichthys calabaricus TaxID=27687 RepID=UPI002234B060|nr:uncharacterized protein LOC114669693 [Erpetoichthys calabaricus]
MAKTFSLRRIEDFKASWPALFNATEALKKFVVARPKLKATPNGDNLLNYDSNKSLTVKKGQFRTDLPERHTVKVKVNSENARRAQPGDRTSLELQHRLEAEGTGYKIMPSTFLLGLFLLMSGQELDSVDKVAEVTAMEGSTVILNCSVPVKGSMSISVEILDWLFNNTTVVHRHEKGADDHEYQHEHFRGRTELFTKELPSGNFSLLLKDVKLNDTGLYTCQAYMSTGSSTNDCQLQVIKRSETERTESPQTMLSQTMDSMARGHMYPIVAGLLFLLVVILIWTFTRNDTKEKVSTVFWRPNVGQERTG